MELRAEFSRDRKAERQEERVGKTSAARRWPEIMHDRSVRLNTKNEPVVGRNIFRRAWPCKGAKQTPWLWTGGTKEVRTRQKCRSSWQTREVRGRRRMCIQKTMWNERQRRFTSCTHPPLLSYQIQRNVHSSGSFIWDMILKNPWKIRKKDLTK